MAVHLVVVGWLCVGAHLQVDAQRHVQSVPTLRPLQGVSQRNQEKGATFSLPFSDKNKERKLD